MAIVENVQRQDLNPVERAKAFLRLKEEFGFNNHQIAKKVSKSVPYVINVLKLLTLPDALKDGLLSGLISEGHARALSAIEDTRMMIEAYKIILKESGSVRRAEELARRMKRASGQKSAQMSDNRNKVLVNEEIDQMQQTLQDTLGKNSNVKLKQSRRETKIQITLKGTPDVTKELLDKLYQAISTIN